MEIYTSFLPLLLLKKLLFYHLCYYHFYNNYCLQLLANILQDIYYYPQDMSKLLRILRNEKNLKINAITSTPLQCSLQEMFQPRVPISVLQFVFHFKYFICICLRNYFLLTLFETHIHFVTFKLTMKSLFQFSYF